MTTSKFIQRPAFDYGGMEEGARIIVKDRTAEIHSLVRMTAQSVRKIGSKLAEVKPLLGGHFVAWLNAEFEWSERSAYNFIRVYEVFKDKPELSGFAPSALYLLSAPSASEEARQAAIAMGVNGEKITHKKAKRLITHYVGRSGEAERDIKTQGTDSVPPTELEIKGSPALFYVNRLTMAIQNGDLDLREDRLTYALHNLADLIKQRVPLHPPR